MVCDRVSDKTGRLGRDDRQFLFFSTRGGEEEWIDESPRLLTFPEYVKYAFSALILRNE